MSLYTKKSGNRFFIIIKELLILVSIVVCFDCTANNASHDSVQNYSQLDANLEVAHGNVSYTKIGILEGHELKVLKDVDLEGGVCELPEDVKLVFKGSKIKNGTLIGKKSRIDCKEAAFDHVTILGHWLVPYIRTSLFVDLNYDNSLKDVFALLSSEIKNTLYIEPGNYYVKTLRNNEECLKVISNTRLILDGTISLQPNDFTNYRILLVEGNYISIEGKGSIIGDKHTHTGTKGEWGMGISIHHSNKVKIADITIKDCWGDCMYIGEESRNIKIEGCNLIHGRRQGISVTSADSVIIRRCTISDVSGTLPEYAIDLEPNRGDSVDHICIEKVTVRGCKGGICAYGTANGARIGSVTIRRCDVESDEKMTIAMVKCGNVLMEKNLLRRNNDKRVIACDQIERIIIRQNELNYLSDASVNKLYKKALVKKSILGPVTVFNSGYSKVVKNKELQQ